MLDPKHPITPFFHENDPHRVLAMLARIEEPPGSGLLAPLITSFFTMGVSERSKDGIFSEIQGKDG